MQLFQELGEISRECNFQLLKHLSKLNILPWYTQLKDASKTRGSLQFLRYDPLTTCFRTLPDVPCRFQDAIKIGRITRLLAHLLSTRLLELCCCHLAQYDGHYVVELSGDIVHVARRAADLDDLGLLEVGRDLLPDDLLAAIPWPCMPDYFAGNGCNRTQANGATARQQFVVFSVGIGTECVGLSAGFAAVDILAVLGDLAGRSNNTQYSVDDAKKQIKVITPFITGDFQGLTIGIFRNASDAKCDRIFNRFYQSDETAGNEKVFQLQMEILLTNNDGLGESAQPVSCINSNLRSVFSLLGNKASGGKIVRKAYRTDLFRWVRMHEVMSSQSRPKKRSQPSMLSMPRSRVRGPMQSAVRIPQRSLLVLPSLFTKTPDRVNGRGETRRVTSLANNSNLPLLCSPPVVQN